MLEQVRAGCECAGCCSGASTQQVHDVAAARAARILRSVFAAQSTCEGCFAFVRACVRYCHYDEHYTASCH